MKLLNTDIQSLMAKIRAGRRKLICFGAGRQLTDACEAFVEFDFFGTIFKIADNNPGMFFWRGKAKEACSPDAVFNLVSPDDIAVYISSSYYPQIYEQLERIPALSDAECYIHNAVVHVPPPYNFEKCQHSKTPLIPGKIHYCWFGGKEIPKQNRIWMETWRRYCPDYEIILWNENTYDVSKNAYMRAAYKERKFAFVSDYARLDIVYEQGGVYLDSDVELFACLDRLLYNEAFCGIYNLYGPNLGLGFGSIPQNPIIREFRDYYDGVSFYNADGTLNQKDCLFYQLQVLRRYGYKTKNIPQLIRGLMIYPADVLSPLDVWCSELAFTDNTVAAHHFDASWLGADESADRKRQLALYRGFFDKHPLALERRERMTANGETAGFNYRAGL
jgi:hypothetical protein